MSDTTDDRPQKKAPVIDELFRTVLGATLREMRLARGERLDDTAARAGISPQYLSEVERGRKDASSEMIAAVIGALDSSLADVLGRVSADLIFGESAEIIDIGSSAGLARSTQRPGAGSGHPTRATLSIAA